MAEEQNTQIFIKLPNSKILTLQSPISITPQSISHLINSQFPDFPNFQTLTLILNGKLLSKSTPTKIPNYSTLTLIPPLLGGKGGFGSLLRGAGTKAGQKKTNNFDACRDMSGRRLRHVNAEKKMEEWIADEGERNLEKAAEKYLKDLAKKGKGGKRNDGAEKYVEKYRKESKRCVEEVERSVREAAAAGLVGKKRKGGGDEVDSKKLKIWKGKRKLDDSDSDSDSDSDDSVGDTDSDASDTENDKSVVLDNGSHSDSSKDTSNGSVPGPQGSLLAGDQTSGGSSDDGGSVEENETLIGGCSEKDTAPSGSHNQSNGNGEMEKLSDGEKKMSEKLCTSADVAATSADEVHEESECKLPEEAIVEKSDVQEVSMPLNFDDFSSSSELEVLGMERLKSELQERGLKCGGTLQERAARLYLLKTTPLDKLPKKLLSKK